MCVLYVVVTVLCDASVAVASGTAYITSASHVAKVLTVLFLVLTVLYVVLIVLYMFLTVLYVVGSGEAEADERAADSVHDQS